MRHENVPQKFISDIKRGFYGPSFPFSAFADPPDTRRRIQRKREEGKKLCLAIVKKARPIFPSLLTADTNQLKQVTGYWIHSYEIIPSLWKGSDSDKLFYTAGPDIEKVIMGLCHCPKNCFCGPGEKEKEISRFFSLPNQPRKKSCQSDRYFSLHTPKEKKLFPLIFFLFPPDTSFWHSSKSARILLWRRIQPRKKDQGGKKKFARLSFRLWTQFFFTPDSFFEVRRAAQADEVV